MPNRQLYDRLKQLEVSATIQLQEISYMKQEVEQLIEENHNLTMENKHLQERLAILTEKTVKKEESTTHAHELSQSLLNLEKIYEQGFHVCNLYYGKRRDNDEDCMFCTSILYGES